jgi:serine protease Do
VSDRTRNFLLIAAGALLIAIFGGYLARNFAPVSQPQQQQQTDPARRPILQIVRNQPGLPSLADTISTLCPSIAAIAPAGATGSVASGFAISGDGWVVVATSALPKGKVEVHFGAGPAVAVTDTRSDPVSGLSIIKTDTTGLRPIRLADQAFPRVGDFGFAIDNPVAAGCSAQAAMIASDFLTDGGASFAYIRLQPMGADLASGDPFISGTGEVLGVVAGAGLPDTVVPADIVADIADELVRNSLSPTTHFGFRAEDFDTSLAGRLSESRSTGTAVSLVQPKTPAARAGLQAGDIVVGVNGSPVASASELGRALDGADKTASLDVARGDERLTLKIGRVPGS